MRLLCVMFALLMGVSAYADCPGQDQDRLPPKMIAKPAGPPPVDPIDDSGLSGDAREKEVMRRMNEATQKP